MTAAEIDAWFAAADGAGLVVTASERAARALTDAYHRARRAEGLAAWPAPNIQDWNSFLRAVWKQLAHDSRLVLNPAQEESLWANIAGSGEHLSTLLEGPRHRMAKLAMDAHALLCSFAPQFLDGKARAAWQQDAAAFSSWLTTFDDTCRSGSLLSPARLPLELIALLEIEPTGRPPLLLAGFDRILPTQRRLFDAWGAWQEVAHDNPVLPARFLEARDTQAEVAACALWCSRRLAADPQARILVVTQDAAARRGEIERAFLRHAGSPMLFEFSLGAPLSQTPIAHGAHLLLRWLTGPLAEHEIDWLVSTGQTTIAPAETSALQAVMRNLRRRGLEQPDWNLNAFLSHSAGAGPALGSWVERMTAAQLSLAEFVRRGAAPPLDWAELVPRLLQTAAWPGTSRSGGLSSAEFQVASRWQQAIEIAGSLGFDNRRIAWQQFLAALTRILDETLFAPESEDAPILIAGPTESAGLTADAVWFLGADEEAWPASGTTHPLLPIEVQRQAGMPHASPQLDCELARSITARLLASAPEVHFSYARQKEDVEARPARLIAQLAGAPQPLPAELEASPAPPAIAVPFEDASRIPFAPGKVEGGSAVLTAQTQCPFKAFATARLAAQGWQAAEPGLNAAQRGQLLHAVLHAIWGGPPDGIRTLGELQGLPDRSAFVASHVRRVLREEIRPALRARLPRRYLELEETRLIRLVTEWLDFEASRIPFEVLETEAERTIPVAGLTFDVRLDRIDRLNNGSLLVIDYKTGNVHPKSWDMPRPDDVQLPLYAGFALEPGSDLGGLAFAKVRPGEDEFAGRIGNARATLIASLGATSHLVKNALSPVQLMVWREYIEGLARSFLDGCAEVDPRDYPKTCERCGLQSLCRVQENHGISESDGDIDDEEAADE